MDDVGQIAITALTQGSVYALIALAFNMIYASTGVLNFAQGEFAMLGALFGYTLLAGVGIPYVAGVVLVTLAVAAVGALFSQAVIQPLLRRQASIDAIIVATIAAAIILRFGAAVIYGNGEFAIPTPVAADPISIVGARVNPQSFVVIGLALLVFVLAWWFFTRTLAGRTFRAVAANPEAATLLGIDRGRVTMTVITASAAICALAGLLYAPLGFASAFIGLSLGFPAIVGAIVGGLGSPVGAVVGGLGIGAVGAVANYQWTGFEDVAIFLVLLVVLLLKPFGVFSARDAVREG